MSKTKLTLYIDENINKLAHKTAKLKDQSISNIVKEYFVQKEKEQNINEISESVSKWIGILHTKKTYKKLRDEYIESKLKT